MFDFLFHRRHHAITGSMENKYADIVLRLALPGTLQFAVPENLRGSIRLGQRVRVPIRNRSDVGYVAGLSDTPKVRGIRPLMRILDREPLLTPELLSLLMWVSDQCLSPPGMVFRTALPRAVHLEKTAGATARTRNLVTYRIAVPREELPPLLEGLEKRAPVQAGLLEFLAEGPREGSELRSFAPTALKALVAKELVKKEEAPLRRGLVSPLEGGAGMRVLTPGQQEVLEKILVTLTERVFSPFLLHGVTGSGKSEIYLRAIEAVPRDRQVMILVPEVTLTVQLLRRFRESLPCPLAVWHHQLSEGEKYDLWRSLRRGEPRILIGARSAVFAPMPDIGLIVVDEEQESSFKQEDVPAYHAREVALRRARESGATVILGSATPSIESYHRAVDGEYTLLELPRRFGNSPLPHVSTVDMKEREQGRKRELLSPRLHRAATEALGKGHQVLFFLNRRGHSPFTHCSACGAPLKCPNCQVSLVFHRQTGSLLCHYCAFTSKRTDTCPSCGSSRLRLSGTGTQRLEEEIRTLFPERSVARLDRDTTSRKGEGSRLVMDFTAGKTDILVGTQMAAKGLHFPRLSVVGVLSPDQSLNLPDFRAAERTFQIVTQVAGRAGREEVAGEVVIQTFQPEHYALQAASRHDFKTFYHREIEFRRELSYPPFCSLVLLRINGPNRQRLEETSDRLAARIRSLLAGERAGGACEILGPVPAPLEKIRNRYRWQLLVKARPLEAATGPLREAMADLVKLANRSNCRVAFDVNPVHLL